MGVFTFIHSPQATGIIEVQGGSRPQGPRMPALHCRFPRHIAFGRPCGWCRPPGLRCAGIVSHQSTWRWALLGRREAQDLLSSQTPLTLAKHPVCLGAGELNQPHKALSSLTLKERELEPIMANRRTFVLLSSDTSTMMSPRFARESQCILMYVFHASLGCPNVHTECLSLLCISGLNQVRSGRGSWPKICTYMLYLPTVPPKARDDSFIMMIDHNSLS